VEVSKCSDQDRLFRYVERFFERAKKTEWPTVRQIARAFGWTQQRVEDAVEGDPEGRTFMTSYFTRPEPPLGEHFVESYGDKED
jgi:hypothetical protein